MAFAHRRKEASPSERELLRQFVSGGHRRAEQDGFKMITVRAPYGSFVAHCLKLIENLRLITATALRSNGGPRWYALKQSREWNDPLPAGMDVAELMITERKSLAYGDRAPSGKMHGKCGIVAVIRVTAVLDTNVPKQAARVPAVSQPWVCGADSDWPFVFVIDHVIPIDPPIPNCPGQSCPIGIPPLARALLIERLRQMGRLRDYIR
jgi:hypothetical protein